MKGQPWDLNQIWPVGRKWCRFTNVSKNFWGPLSPNLGRKNITFWPLFATSALDIAYLRNETSHQQTIHNVSPKISLLFVTFGIETAEIRWLIVTHRMKIQHFPSLPGFRHKGHWIQANPILPDVRELKGLTKLLSTVKKFGGGYVATTNVATCVVCLWIIL